MSPIDTPSTSFVQSKSYSMKEDNVRRMVHSGRCLNVGAWGCVCAAYEQQSGNDSDECNDPGDDIRSIENLPTIMIA